MDDDSTAGQQKRKPGWVASYSDMTQAQADERLGIRIESLISDAIPVDEMLAKLGYRLEENGLDANIKETKEKVYDHIVEYIDVAGYPTEAIADPKDAIINHLVYATIIPILRHLIRSTGHKSMRLRFEKDIVSVDGETGGTGGFVMVDLVSVTEEMFVLIVELKKASPGLAMRQCFLAMKDMRDNNCGGEMYGFVTTGKQWQMIRYDGTFQVTDPMDVMFARMGEKKELWMTDYSIVVDCVYAALRNHVRNIYEY